MDKDLRRQVIERDRGKCVRCGVDCEHKRHSVHHRRYKSRGGTDDPSNLVLLCGSGGDTAHCHGAVHATSEEGYVIPSHGPDPAEVPVYYWRRGPVLLTSTGSITDAP